MGLPLKRWETPFSLLGLFYYWAWTVTNVMTPTRSASFQVQVSWLNMITNDWEKFTIHDVHGISLNLIKCQLKTHPSFTLQKWSRVQCSDTDCNYSWDIRCQWVRFIFILTRFKIYLWWFDTYCQGVIDGTVRLKYDESSFITPILIRNSLKMTPFPLIAWKRSHNAH